MARRMGVLGLVLAACGLALVGCGGERDEGGAEVVVQALSAADVARVTLTITGDGIAAPIVNDLTRVGAQWVGRINAIPAGAARTFDAAARDGAGTLLYQGQAIVDIGAGERVVVAIVAQQAAAPAPFANSAPVNESLVASRSEVAPGDRITLIATARDADPGDTLSWAWTSATGSFTSGAAPATDWIAPPAEGMDTLRVTVTDSHGASASMELQVLVTARAGRGSANVTVTLNTAPEVTNTSALPARIDAGETTALDVVATDADGDTLAYAWSTGCAGTFSAPAARMTTFTLSALPAGGACTFRAAVADGRGGANRGEITVAAGPGPAPNLAPQITSAYQSVATALGDEVVRFEVQAYDPDGTPVTFAWSADQGTIEWTAASGGTGTMRWRAPPCFPVGASARIDARVTDGAGVTTTETFAVASGSATPCGWAEEFTSSTLGPDWNVIVAEGNSYSLTAAPGSLRYQLSTSNRTHYEGFLNGYVDSTEYSCCNHDPGLEIWRPIAGERWLLEARVTYYLPYANGRRLAMRVYFGEGAAMGYADSTFFVEAARGRDISGASTWSSVVERFGTSTSQQNTLASGGDPTDWNDLLTIYWQIERDAGRVTARRSFDGATWTTLASHDFGTALSGLAQRVTLAGLYWYGPGYAEYDYIRYTQL